MELQANKDDWFAEKMGWLRKSFFAFLVGLLFAIMAAFIKHQVISVICMIIFMIPFAWFLGVLCFIPIIHWKDRYRGTHPYIWGVFLVFETSGWSKIFYWFMHVLPDKNGTGIYMDANA